jgi:uncharacterized membrane protein YgaE (UPF0421/DUF939 family)
MLEVLLAILLVVLIFALLGWKGAVIALILAIFALMLIRGGRLR